MNRAGIVIILLLFISVLKSQNTIDNHGAIIRSKTSEKTIFLCFTGHDFYEGFDHVLRVLESQKVNASFFLTGDFIRNHNKLSIRIMDAGHYIGAHSDKHLLYCDWTKRDSLLHSTEVVKADIRNNLCALEDLGIQPQYFMPPYEWYNSQVVEIAKVLGQITINFSPGTRSNADYTTPNMSNYISSADIIESIYAYEESNSLNGFHLLIHPGTSALRKDKLYMYLDDLMTELKRRGYQFERF